MIAPIYIHTCMLTHTRFFPDSIAALAPVLLPILPPPIFVVMLWEALTRSWANAAPSALPPWQKLLNYISLLSHYCSCQRRHYTFVCLLLYFLAVVYCCCVCKVSRVNTTLSLVFSWSLASLVLREKNKYTGASITIGAVASAWHELFSFHKCDEYKTLSGLRVTLLRLWFTRLFRHRTTLIVCAWLRVRIVQRKMTHIQRGVMQSPSGDVVRHATNTLQRDVRHATTCGFRLTA